MVCYCEREEQQARAAFMKEKQDLDMEATLKNTQRAAGAKCHGCCIRCKDEDLLTL